MKSCFLGVWVTILFLSGQFIWVSPITKQNRQMIPSLTAVVGHCCVFYPFCFSNCAGNMVQAKFILTTSAESALNFWVSVLVSGKSQELAKLISSESCLNV